jgi:hypothetical protein
MTRKLSPAQRRAVSGSDPSTGRLSADPRVCTALVAAGLAVPHGRGGHHSHYLTAEGRRLREELARAAGRGAGRAGVREGADGPAEEGRGGIPEGADGRGEGHGDMERGGGEPPEGPAAGGSFRADDGTGDRPAPPPAVRARRAAEVAAAWEGLLQIRAVLADGATGVPAPWERDRPVHAVALALEAAGCPPARPDSPGYRVTASAHPGLAEVTWTQPSSAPAALAKCARLLAAYGWQPTTHRTRAGDPYLLTSPATR